MAKVRKTNKSSENKKRRRNNLVFQLKIACFAVAQWTQIYNLLFHMFLLHRNRVANLSHSSCHVNQKCTQREMQPLVYKAGECMQRINQKLLHFSRRSKENETDGRMWWNGLRGRRRGRHGAGGRVQPVNLLLAAFKGSRRRNNKLQRHLHRSQITAVVLVLNP